MKRSLPSLLALLLFLPFGIQAQNLGVSDADSTFRPEATALLDMSSSQAGFLMPRLTTAERLAITSPAEGLLVFDTDSAAFYFYQSGWLALVSDVGSARIARDADSDTKIEVEASSDEDIIRFSSDGEQVMEVGDTGTIYLGTAGDHTYVLKNGTVRMVGDGTTYTDLCVPASTTTSASSGILGPRQPQYEMFMGDSSGNSHGVYAHRFYRNTTRELYFMVQLPHSWKEGSDLHPHIHWSTSRQDVDNDKIRWGLEYSWANVGSTFGSSQTVYGQDPIPIAAPVDKYLHTITPLTSINGSGKSLSSILICRVFRDGSHPDDDHENGVHLLMIDFHYEEDAFGSNQEFTK